MRFGQGKTGNFVPCGQTRQIVVPLRVGAVMQQQFSRSKRIWNHESAGNRDAAAGNFHDHARVGDRREFQAAIPLWNDHAEETLRLEKFPNMLRKFAVLSNLPIVDQAAKFFHRSIEKSPLALRKRLNVKVDKLPPVRPPGKQLPVPPNRAGFDGDAFGIAHARHESACAFHYAG